MNTINGLIAGGYIPRNVPDAVIKQMETRLGLSGNRDEKLSSEKLNAIIYSKELTRYRVGSSIKSKHDSVISEYQELINQYNNIKKYIDGNKSLDPNGEILANVNDLLNTLTTEEASYKNQVSNFRSVNDYFKFNSGTKLEELGAVQNKVAEFYDKKLSNVDERLGKLYKKLDTVKQRKYHGIGRKIKAGMEVRRLEAKIEALKQKHGVLYNAQSRIVNSHTNRYINAMNRRFDRQFDELNKLNDLIEYNKEINDNINDLQNDMNQALSNGKLRKRDRLERKMNRLKNKQGKINGKIHMEAQINSKADYSFSR